MKKVLQLALLTPLFLQATDFNLVKRANRKTDAKNVKVTNARNQASRVLLPQPTNGDEARYTDKRGSFGKGLRQLPSGLIDPTAFNALVNATETESPTDFNRIPMGTNPIERRLTSPQAGISYNMLGADSDAFSIIAPPTVASAQKAGEMVELYWMALLRNVNFTDYQAESMMPGSFVAEAIAALNALSDFRGPRNEMGNVDAQTLFREELPGALEGPMISQLFYRDVPYCETTMIQTYRVPLASDPNAGIINDFVTTDDVYRAIERGENPTTAITFDPVRRYIRNISDIGSYVHNDPLQWPYFCALLILLGYGQNYLDQANPYIGNPTQFQFADFFQPQFASLLSVCGELALRAAWHQKWFVHRTLRPEAFAFLVNQQVSGIFDYGLSTDITGAQTTLQSIAERNNALNGTVEEDVYFLPLAYPEGSPTHPSYPAGHATVAGASITLLKAFFNGDLPFPPHPDFPDATGVVPNANGTALVPYNGTPLTITGELNKFAMNIAVGRNMAGVHWRSDATESLLLGEQVALRILEDWARNNHIPFDGFTLTLFDGTRVTVGATRVAETI